MLFEVIFTKINLISLTLPNLSLWQILLVVNTGTFGNFRIFSGIVIDLVDFILL